MSPKAWIIHRPLTWLINGRSARIQIDGEIVQARTANAATNAALRMIAAPV